MSSNETSLDDLHDDNELEVGAESTPDTAEVEVESPRNAKTETSEEPENESPNTDSEGAPATDAEEPADSSADSGTAEEDENPVSGIDRYLAKHGIIGGMIEFEADADNPATSSHFSELSSEEQLTILTELAESDKTSAEDEYGLDQDEISLLNYVRENGNVEAAVNQLAQDRVAQIMALEQSNNVNYSEMSDDAITTKWLKENNPEASEESIANELERQKESEFYEKTVKSLRSQYLQNQELEIQKSQAEAQQAIEDERNEDRVRIATEVADMDQVAGWNLTDDMKNSVLEDIMEVNADGDSLFMEEVFSDPQKLFKAAWLYKYGESHFDQLEKYYKDEMTIQYVKGKNDAVQGLPSKPISGSSSQTSSNKSFKKPIVDNRVENTTSLDDLHAD